MRNDAEWHAFPIVVIGHNLANNPLFYGHQSQIRFKARPNNEENF
jgi:hypothetical protein